MIRQGASRHDTLHLISAVLMPFIFEALKYGKEFDEGLYRSLLKKYKNKKPDKAARAIERDLIA